MNKRKIKEDIQKIQKSRRVEDIDQKEKEKARIDMILMTTKEFNGLNLS